MSVFDTGNAGFNPNLEKIERSDPVSADFVNGLLYQLINNDVAIMEAASRCSHRKMIRLFSF